MFLGVLNAAPMFGKERQILLLKSLMNWRLLRVAIDSYMAKITVCD